MKRYLMMLLWTVAGYFAGAIVVGFVMGILFSMLIGLGFGVRGQAQWVSGISMGAVAVVTISFFIQALRGRLPGTRRALPAS